MPAGGRKSAISSQNGRTQRSQSLVVPSPADRNGCDASDANDTVIPPHVNGVRQLGAETHQSPPQSDYKRSKKTMVSSAPQRSHSDSRVPRSKENAPKGDNVRKKEHSVQQNRLSTVDGRRNNDHREKVTSEEAYTDFRAKRDKSRPNGLRRSMTTDGTSRARHERSHKEDRASTRRRSEREVPRYEGVRPRTPLRQEQEFVSADEIQKYSRSRPPTRNSNSQSAWSPFTLLSFLQRNRPAIERTSSSKMSSRNVPAHNVRSRHGLEENLSTSRHPAPTSRPGALSTHPRATDKLGRSPTMTQGSKAGERSSGTLPPHMKSSNRPEPPKMAKCEACFDEKPISKCPKLNCSHRMCHSCLKRLFSLAITDSEHMPPKCCTPISADVVERLFDTRFKLKFNRKSIELATKNRIYCPSKGCGRWIKPKDTDNDGNNQGTHTREYVTCTKCYTKVCRTCNTKWHKGRDCPKDPAAKAFRNLAKENGWQECYNCKAVVELKEGCYHMTCKCKAEFCMCCGAKWKTCNCMMFSDAAVRADRLANMVGEVPLPNPAAEERVRQQRRLEQERRDEALARAMEQRGMRFMNEEFMRQAMDPFSGVFNPVEDTVQQQEPPRATEVGAQPQRPPRQPFIVVHRSNLLQQRGHQNERVLPARDVRTYDLEAEIHRPVTTERASLLAGMGRGQSGSGRVEAWRRHVNPVV